MRKTTILALATMTAFTIASCSSNGDETTGPPVDETTGETTDNGDDEGEATGDGEYALPDNIASSGQIIVGNSPVYPPMSYLPEGVENEDERVGFDVDLSQAIADELGIEVVYQREAYEQYIPSLDTGRIDVIQSAMQDIPDRRETVTFVDYIFTGPQLFTNAARDDLQSFEDLCGGSVVLDIGDVGYVDALEANNEDRCGDDLITIVDASSNADALLQMEQGRADATIRGTESVRYMIEDGAEYRMIGEPLVYIPVGIGINMDNEVLVDAIAAALQTLIDDGTYLEIATKWGMEDLALDAVMINGEEI